MAATRTTFLRPSAFRSVPCCLYIAQPLILKTMNSFSDNNIKTTVRPLQYRDLDTVMTLVANACVNKADSCSVALVKQLQQYRNWYLLHKILSLFPNPYQHHFCFYVAEQGAQVRGLVQVAPFNRTRSTWRVERILVETSATLSRTEIGSMLLRHCFETLWEARTWILEVNVNHNATLALYRQSGFQPLAQLTYWAIAPEILAELAEREPKLPNLLPVSNADAQLICQLDTVSMPPILRQVFDRNIQDFKTTFLGGISQQVQRWLGNQEVVRGYVFEPQRKAAIGYFNLQICKDGSQPHQAELTVHPAYTWLYPELVSQMAQVVQNLPSQSLQLASADYQPEREEYLEKIGAQRIEHALLMSRSVWHKLRESKPSTLESLQLSEVLQGLKPARTPIPSRMSWQKAHTSGKQHSASHTENGTGSTQKEDSHKSPESE